MNTQHLEYILEVYNCGSINKAAKYCYISQSHLSKIIKDLENELGYSIIVRSKSGLVFTSAGIAFIKLAEKIVQECTNIKNLPKQVSQNQILRIACSPNFFLLSTFIDFERISSDSGTGGVLKETGLRNILRLLIAEECQLGIMSMFEQTAAKYQNLAEKHDLEFHTLRTGIPMVVNMSKLHPLAKLDKVYLKDMETFPFVVDANVDQDDNQPILNTLSTNTILQMASLSCMEMALKKSNYISIKMETQIPYDSHNELCARPIEDFKERSGIYLLRPKNKPMYEREKQYISFLKKQVEKQFKTLSL